MEEMVILCKEELEKMTQDEIIKAYLLLKERFYEQLAIDAEKDRQIKVLSERLNLYNAKQFGKSTETAVSFSGSHSEKETETSAVQIPQSPHMDNRSKSLKNKRPKKKAGCAQRIKEGLPVYHVDITLSEEELKEQFGNYRCRELPEQTYDILRYRKACLYIERRHIHVYTAGGKIVRAGSVDKMTPKSLVSPEVLAGILEAKFVMSIPISRIEQHWKRSGGQLARQTIYGWIIRYAFAYFEVLVMRMRELMLKSGHIQADETSVIVKETIQDKKIYGQCYFWVFSTSELWPEERIILFQYERSRAANVLREFLKGYSGTLTSDAYASYQTFEKEQNGLIILTGCLTHLRRYFVDALKAMKGFRCLNLEQKKKIPAYEAIEQLKEIFRIEKTLQALSSAERLSMRKEKIQPRMEAFFTWIHSFKEGDFEKGGLMQKAINYAKNQEVYLKRFLDDGYVPIHNSASERSIIPLCIGRNNWKIIASENGATAAAYVYSIAETAKANLADPFYYFKFLLEKLPCLLKEHKLEKDLSYLDDFMPWTKKYHFYELAQKDSWQQGVGTPI